MFLRHTRADRRQYQNDFRLRKPKNSRVNTPDHTISTNSLQQLQPNENFSIDGNGEFNNNYEESGKDHDTDFDREFGDGNREPDDNNREFGDDNREFDNYNREFNNDIEFDNDNLEFSDDGKSDDIDRDFNQDYDINEKINGQEYDNNKKQNYYTGNAGPYFPNFTTFLLFLWVTKHQIGI
jgi:hypothetical protein